MKPAVENIPNNLQPCYAELSALEPVETRGLNLLEAWLSAIAEVECSRSQGA